MRLFLSQGVGVKKDELPGAKKGGVDEDGDAEMADADLPLDAAPQGLNMWVAPECVAAYLVPCHLVSCLEPCS